MFPEQSENSLILPDQIENNLYRVNNLDSEEKF